MSGARLGARDETNVVFVEEGEGLWRDALGEERRKRSASRYSGERSRSGSPSFLSGKEVENDKAAAVEDEDALLNSKETCLQEMGKDSGVFVGFLPYEINLEEDSAEDSQEPLHVVVKSNTDRLILPLPPLPPPIEAPCPSELWSLGAEQSRTTYLDGMTVLTDAQIQDGCAFIDRARQTTPSRDGSELPSPESAGVVWILSPRLRPEEAMSLAICYLAYSSSPPASIINPAPPPSVSSKVLPTQSQSSDANSNSSESPLAPVVVIPFGSANPNPTQEQINRTRKLSFPGSWDDELDVFNDVDSSLPPKFREPRYTPAHALYMHLHDDIDGDVDLERELWDAAEEREAFMGGSGGGGTGVGAGGELEEEQMGITMGPSEAASTTKSVFAGARGGHHRRRLRDLGSDDCERERDGDGDQTRERGGTEYKCMRPEWRGVLSFEGLRRLDGVWLGRGVGVQVS